MGEWHREHPEEATAGMLPSEQLEAERAMIPDPLEQADNARKARREEILSTMDGEVHLEDCLCPECAWHRARWGY